MSRLGGLKDCCPTVTQVEKKFKFFFRSGSRPSEGVGRKTGYLGPCTRRAELIPVLFMIWESFLPHQNQPNKFRRRFSDEFSSNSMDLATGFFMKQMENTIQSSAQRCINCALNKNNYHSHVLTGKSTVWRPKLSFSETWCHGWATVL